MLFFWFSSFASNPNLIHPASSSKKKKTVAANSLHRRQHRRRTAKQDLAVLVLEGLSELLLDEVLGDEPGGSVPLGGRVVEDVVDLESTFGLCV